MALSERKKKILRAVVDGYIETAQPVSSKEIQEKHLPDCSSATIRNELSALESMGYLTQPHISAGRAPSEKAFRLYVDELMETGPLTANEIALIDKYFNHRIDNVEDVVKNVAQVLSEITHYTSVVVKEKPISQRIDSIKLLQLSEEKALVVIVTDVSVLKDNFIDLPQGIDEKMIYQAQKWLNKLFGGKTLGEICSDNAHLTAVDEDFALYRELYEKVFAIIIKMNYNNGSEVITNGANKMLDYPEYSADADKAKSFLNTIEKKKELAELFASDDEKNEFSVKIGGDEGESNLPEGCSLVTAKIALNDKVSGSAGVIGPVRMNYKKVVSVLDHISKLLDNILGEEDKK